MPNQEALGISLGLLGLICLAAYGLHASRNKRNKRNRSALKRKSNRSTNISENEQIRQFGNIAQADFEDFYEPVIAKSKHLLEKIGDKGDHVKYLTSIKKTLRKRKGAIFEHGNAEADKKREPLWSYALFIAVTVRYVSNRLEQYDVSVDNEPVYPHFLQSSEHLTSIATYVLKDRTINESHKHARVHLIEEFIDPVLATNLVTNGIYQYLLGTITDTFKDRFNQFYTVVVDVENHVYGKSLSDDQRFSNQVTRCLGLIASGAFEKNRPTSMIVESVPWLLVEKNFLWSLYNSHSVYQREPLTLPKFIERIHKVLELHSVPERGYVYDLTLNQSETQDYFDENESGLNDLSLVVCLHNMIALPYKKIPDFERSIEVKNPDLCDRAHAENKLPNLSSDTTPVKKNKKENRQLPTQDSLFQTDR